MRREKKSDMYWGKKQDKRKGKNVMERELVEGENMEQREGQRTNSVWSGVTTNRSK